MSLESQHHTNEVEHRLTVVEEGLKTLTANLSGFQTEMQAEMKTLNINLKCLGEKIRVQQFSRPKGVVIISSIGTVIAAAIVGVSEGVKRIT